MKERYLWRAALVAAFLSSFGWMATSASASMAISPVRVDLSDDNDKDVIRVTNQESSVRSYQVEVVAWSQTDQRREVYSSTDDVLAVPPLFTLNPGEEQIIRLGLMTKADAQVEKSYRLFITELESPKDSDASSSGLSMRIQVGVPVFVMPEAMPSVNLSYVESQRVGEQYFARFRNNGNIHVKVTEVQYTPSDDGEVVSTQAVVYLLAGKSALLPVPLQVGEKGGSVTIVTDSLGAMEYVLPTLP